MIVAEILFWSILGLNALTFLGYPAFVIAASAFVRKQSNMDAADTAPTDAASVIICAFNEEAVIGEKLRTVLDQDGDGALEVMVLDDGSSDRTADIAEAIAAEQASADLKVHRMSRGGKAAAMNFAIAHASHDILVMTDADPLWRRDTLATLLAPFGDPSVGAVAGNVLTSKQDDGDFADSEAGYRNYETTLRRAESRLFGCISADGGLYAIRKALVGHLPDGVTDDFYISTASVLQGQRLVMETSAIAYENSIQTGRQQFRRRVRITSRGLRAVWKRRALLKFWQHGFYSVGLFFHKVLRRVAPPLLLLLPPLMSIMALNSPVFAILSLGAWAGLVLAATPFFLSLSFPKPVITLNYVLIGVLGLGLGLVNFLAGRTFVTWTPQKTS